MYIYIPNGLEEGNNGDVPNVRLFHQCRESTEQDNGRPYGRQRPQAVHRLLCKCLAEDKEVEQLFRQQVREVPYDFHAAPLCFLAILAMGLIADTRMVSHMMSSTKRTLHIDLQLLSNVLSVTKELL